MTFSLTSPPPPSPAGATRSGRGVGPADWSVPPPAKKHPWGARRTPATRPVTSSEPSQGDAETPLAGQGFG
jgi:hypothetical protein